MKLVSLDTLFVYIYDELISFVFNVQLHYFDIAEVSGQYIGCYKDAYDNRTLENCVYCGYNATQGNKNNTLESCCELCAERKYSYAGTQVTNSRLMISKGK